MGGVVKIADVSDFISPSQACILPMPGQSESKSNLVKLRKKTERPVLQEQKITVSLKDCLACSGCVTTAETVLIQSQTADEMLAGLSSSKVGFVTVSPQALASLAAELELTMGEMARVLAKFFKSKGAEFVVDSSFGRYFSLLECLEELKDKLRNRKKKEMLMSGICPGFVCYSEKRKKNDVVPYISSIRSPQAVMGVLIKDYLVRKLSKSVENIYHVAVMPCYDKKLEASRGEFGSSVGQDTDCVVTPSELLPLIKEFRCDEDIQVDTEMTWLNSLELGCVIGDYEDETSGGYTKFILDSLTQTLTEENQLVDVQTESQNDLERYTINMKNGETLTLVKAYGFRNIQNLVRRITQGRHEVDYVEVMACPKGCLNGGGQIRNPEPALQDIRVNKVKEVYKQANQRDLLEQQYKEVRDEWQSLNPEYRQLLTAKIQHVQPPAANSVAAMAW
ncbi:unnamed protein product [Bursaphelenchus okinawaensis]|uniref:Iron hydrogenase large subunit C-terminal domain-containing protein n=1 Tax=Bursaphelenchus okinawaensis TaxID=465554 RepID=A0A811KQR6_9BILA|nr:unnamed protein product [Bursaphelenchus okinawaensis]CAG9108171.1 unnamed protein product [Bursaphelenchus okinawaensis]